MIDLGRPEDPFVAGELEVTGFSDYLHPLDGGYVLGVGKDAIPDLSGDSRGAWYQGVKVSLNDVSDPSNAFEADAVIIGKRGTYTPVLGDHRAFTFLKSEGANARVAIGAVVGSPTQQPGRPMTPVIAPQTAGRKRSTDSDPPVRSGPAPSWCRPRQAEPGGVGQNGTLYGKKCPSSGN